METINITLTSPDHERLGRLIEQNGNGRDRQSAVLLEEELSRALVVSPNDVPPDVVTMNSRFDYVDEGTGVKNTVTLVYPQEASPSEGKISVLSPVGAALIGLRVGQSITWTLPNGRTRKLRIEAIHYQPEAAGDHNL